jgi:hypothetical protein
MSDLALLRLLLDDPRLDPDDLDWSVILPAAIQHRMLLRLAAWFDRRHELPPAEIAASIDRERQRLNGVIALVARIEERCAQREIDHVFLKLAQQLPDVGRDLDLLVSGTALDVDASLVGQDQSGTPQPNLRGRLAGTTSYPVPACDITIAVHHGRVGRLGEHERYARQLLRRQRRVCVGSVSFTALCPEDAFLLQVLDRLYGRPTLRLRDVHWAITTVRGGALDWDYLIGAARATGIIAGLSCYLGFVDQVHQELFGRALLRADLRQRLESFDWGTVAFTNGSYHFPAARVTGRLYFTEFWSDVATGNWEAASRLFFLPVVAAAAGYRRLANPTVGGS